jgi:hypothetical protein
MTLKANMSLNVNSQHADSVIESERNEKYRLLVSIIEKKVAKITKSNEKIAAR